MFLQKLSPIARFSVLCVLSLIVFGVALGWTVTSALEKNMIARAEQVTAAFLQSSIKEHFTPDDFTSPRLGSEYDAFSRKFRPFLLGAKLARVKFWDRNSVIIWADEKRLVGERFPENREVREAFEGKARSVLKKFQENREYRFEKSRKPLLELHVPVSTKNDGRYDIVCETYQDIDQLYQDMAAQKRMIWSTTAAGTALLYAILFGIFYNASKLIKLKGQEIERSEAQYRNLVNSAQDGILSIDASGKIVFYNQAAATLFGYGFEELKNIPLTDLMPQHYRARHQEVMRRFVAGNAQSCSNAYLEFEGMRKNGDVFSLELSLSATRSSDGTQMTAILRDLTFRKAAQEQLVKVERAEAISVIAAGIGHELNNCVTALKGYATLLMASPQDRQLAASCAEIFSSLCQRLQLFGKNLLTIGHPQKPKLTSFDIKDLLDQVTDLLSSSGLLRRYTIRKQYQEVGHTVMGDQMLLEQAMMNLIINALHAMPEDGTLTLSTCVDTTAGLVQFSIADTGHGIPEELKKQIFIPFFTTKELGKGTGLGLHIVKEIVESHRGSIDIDSEVGRGTQVTIAIPAASCS